ncbi:hypothetical protein [Absidia glauca]|uniref:Uncharacterized protein n=1 Tax=Absidia glauca TaxID=4829 RepID=A0A168LUQ7_ABSGL|nr:hypothetical protein [Absidia glauca]
MASIPTTISTISSHPVAEELTEELEQLLDIFCSDVQQQFCLDQHVATQQQLSRIKETIQQARTLLQGKWILNHQRGDEYNNSHPHLHVRQALMRTCLEMIDSYQAIAHQRQIRNLSDRQAQQWMHVDWQQLSQRFDTKAREQTQWTLLLSNLKDLQKAWHQRPHQQVNKIIHSFLMTSFDPPAGCHIVAVDRHNYAQLGLKRKAIGSRQLVFECHILSRQEQIATVSNLCQRFATVFGENAHHNLSQVDAQLKRGQPYDLQRKCQTLYQRLFLPLEAHSSSIEASQHSSFANDNNQHFHQPLPPSPPVPYLDPLQQQRVDHWYANQDQHNSRAATTSPKNNPSGQGEEADISTPINDYPHNHPSYQNETPGVTTTAGKATAVTTSAGMTFRPTPFVDTTSLTLQHIPLPNFIPSPWQWPDLLKIRQPYRPLFFGLIKRRKKRNGNSSGFFYRLRHLFYTSRKTSTTLLNKDRYQQQHHHPSTDTTTSGPFSANEAVNNANAPISSSPSSSPSGPSAPITPTPDNLSLMYPVFASISMTQLGQHFIWTSQRFYQDIMLHCQLKYQQDSAVLKEIGDDLVHMYAALQLDISRLAMQRIVTILHELNTIDPPVSEVPNIGTHDPHSALEPSDHPQSMISLEGV